MTEAIEVTSIPIKHDIFSVHLCKHPLLNISFIQFKSLSSKQDTSPFQSVLPAG